MDEEAAGYFDYEYMLHVSREIGKLHVKRMKYDNGRDAIITDFKNVTFNGFKAVYRYADDIFCFIVYTENEDAIVGIGHCRQVIGQIVAIGFFYSTALKPDFL